MQLPSRRGNTDLLIENVGHVVAGQVKEERTSDPVKGRPQKEGVRARHPVEPHFTGLDLISGVLIGCLAWYKCRLKA